MKLDTANPATWPPPNVKWFYSDDYACIAHGDCREILPLLPKVDDLACGINYITTFGIEVEGCYYETTARRLSQEVLPLHVEERKETQGELME